MPTKNSDKVESLLSREKYTAELSSGQLVLGVCMLIAFGLACFMIGVLVGKFEPSPRGDVARASPSATTQTAEEARSRTPSLPLSPLPERSTTDAPPNQNVSPPSRTSTVGPHPPAKTPAVQAAPAESVSASPGPRPVPFPASSAPRQAPNETVDAAAAAANTVPTGSPAPPAPELRPLEIDDEMRPAPAQDGPPAPAAPAGPRFGVQIAALEQRRNAERLKRDVESMTAHSADLVEPPDSRLVLVIVGSYPDRAEAEKVRLELRDRYGYKDCFVVQRP